MKPALKDDFQFNVLVVDDDTTILSLLREILEMVPGCHVTTVNDPAAAVQEVMNNRIDIVFTDIHMPGTTGLEFLEDLVKLEKTPEVIVMTAFPTGEDAQKAMELGAMSFISKPFEDIKVVEVELEKAIKKVLRQRHAEKEVELKKLELSKIVPKDRDQDPPMHITLPPAPSKSEVDAAQREVIRAKEELAESRRPTPEVSEAGISTSTPSSTISPEAHDFQSQRRSEGELELEMLDDDCKPVRPVYALPFLQPLVEVEVERCKRHRRQFVVGMVDLPEPKVSTDREAFRNKQRYQLEQIVRRSDVLFEMGEDRQGIVGFECNKVGSEVLEKKLASMGFENSAFSVYPADGATADDLLDLAKERLMTKRKLQIVVFEPDEFFGRLVINMLPDPKYNVKWLRTHQDFYNYMTMETENVKLVILNLSKDKEQWRLMAKMMREGLVRWPVLLGVDAVLTKEVKEKLSQLGVRAIVHRSASQEEFQYLVQSFAVPKPQNIERKNYRALVALPVIHEQGGKKASTVTFTLSREGMFVRDMSPPAAGEFVNLQIFTPGNAAPITTKVEVLYAIPYFVGVNRVHVAGFACRFLDLSDDQRQILDDIIAKSLTSYLL